MASKEAIAIIVDVGSSVWRDAVKDTKPGFLDRAVQCVSMIIKRKIFAKSKDEIALIVMGTEETDNSLDYENITVAYPLILPSWEMLNFVDKDLKGTKINTDWLDSIVVAMDLLKRQTESKVFSEKKIVLFTDLSSQVSEDKIEPIIKAMKNQGFHLIVIGPDVHLNVKDEAMDTDTKHGFANGTENKKTKAQLYGEQILKKILDEAGGVVCSFEDAVPQLMFYQKKNIRPTPWNILLDIGPDIKIPVAGYKKIQPATLPSFKPVLEGGGRVESETVYTRQDENLTNVNKEDLIDGYHYGTTLVPLSDVDIESMGYKSGSKCLTVLCFTKTKNVPRHLLVGNGTMFITTQKNDDTGVYALSALINAMIQEDLVAIVRKVQRDNTGPYLGVLFPKKSTYECLVCVDIPFSEDMREFTFPSLKTDTNQPSQQQLDAIDVLIDTMDLTSVTNEFGEKSEVFKPKNILNPYFQHWYSSLAFRALHPDEELPPASEDVMNLIKSPFENKPSYKLAVEEIQKHFPLQEVKQKQTRKAANDFFKVDEQDEPNQGPSGVNLNDITMTDLIQPTVLEVGSLKPVEDFETLLEKGEPLNKLCIQMQRVIMNLIVGSFGNDNFSKAESALREMRGSCVLKNPSLYNDWMPKFRENLFERGRKTFWDIIVRGNLGLISSDESASSYVSDADARKFLEYEEIKEEAPAEAMDEDDLLNEM